MINVILIHPDGEEYEATLDDTGTDVELRQDIIAALQLEGTADDYDVRLAAGIKLEAGCRIKVERKRKPKVTLQQPSKVNLRRS